METRTQEGNKREDRRSARSKRLILQALRELILEKDYKAISVTDIVERADVGRATFYAHFEDKAALGRFIFGNLLGEIEQGLEKSLADVGEAPLAQRLLPSLALFRVAGEKQAYFKVNATNPEIGLSMLVEPLTERFLRVAKEAGIEEGGAEVALRMRAKFLVSALIALLTDWVVEDMPLPPEEMDRLYQALAAPSLEGLGERAGA